MATATAKRREGAAASATVTQQRDVLRAVHRHALDHGTWPGRHWLAAVLKVKPEALQRQLRALKRRGLVDWDAQSSRGVRLVGLRVTVYCGGDAAGKRLMGEELYPKAYGGVKKEGDDDGEG